MPDWEMILLVSENNCDVGGGWGVGGDVLCEENIMQRSPDITIHAPLEHLGRLVSCDKWQL